MARGRRGGSGGPPGGRPPLGGGRRWWTLVAAVLASFLLTLSDAAPAVALPSIGRDLGLGVTGLEWVVNAYTLAVAMFLLAGGSLADRLGHRPVFLLGLAIATLASLAAGLAPSGPLLLGARAVQGVGAALVIPTALAMVSSSFGRGRRGLAIGLWAGASSSALAIGPLIGAALSESGGWRWIFLLNVPIGVLVIAAGRLLLDGQRARREPLPLDRAGLVTSGVGLFALVFAFSEGSSYGWRSPLVIALLGVGALAGALFLRVERRARAPLLDLSLFRQPVFAGANVVTLLATSVMCSVFFFLSLYLQLELRYSPIGAGAVFLPMTGLILALSPLAGRLSDRLGRRPAVVAGLLLLAGGLLLLSRLGLDGELAPLLAGLALIGLGVAFVTTPATAAALDTAPAEQEGLASGVLNTSRMVGLALGIATMGAIVAARWPGGYVQAAATPGDLFADGLALAFLVNAGVAGATALVAALALGAAPRAASPVRPTLAWPAEGPGGRTRSAGTQAARDGPDDCEADNVQRQPESDSGQAVERAGLQQRAQVAGGDERLAGSSERHREQRGGERADREPTALKERR